MLKYLDRIALPTFPGPCVAQEQARSHARLAGTPEEQLSVCEELLADGGFAHGNQTGRAAEEGASPQERGGDQAD